MKTGQPSETAARIAINALAARLDPELRRLLPHPEEPFSEWFVEEHSPQARNLLAKWRAGSPLMRKMSDVMEPGGALFVLVRKLWIEDGVRRAMAEGRPQMAVLGAGYDTLCLHLARELPSARFWELDHPDTQAVKQRALQAHDALPDALRLAPLDLAEGGPEAVLAACGWETGQRSVVVAEGVLMYVEEEALDAVLASVARVLAPGSRFFFSMIDRRSLKDPRSTAARMAKLLAVSGEPFRSSIDPEEVPAFLAARGFRWVDTARGRDLARAYLEPRGIARAVSEAEFLVEAEREG